MEDSKKKSHSREREILGNPPIIEALLEIRWKVEFKGNFLKTKYKFLSSHLYDLIKSDFPVIEILPATQLPDKLNSFLPRYRFRVAKASYPLIQIGPGILTINVDKANFLSQNTFHDRCMAVLEIFLQNFQDFELDGILIHYIDVFNSTNQKIFEFLREKLNTTLEYKQTIFQNSKVPPNPSSIRIETDFMINNPKGIFSCKIRSGKKEKEEIILMDTIFQSKGTDMPPKDKISTWFQAADDLIHEWFYEMVRNYKEIW